MHESLEKLVFQSPNTGQGKSTVSLKSCVATDAATSDKTRTLSN